MSAETVVRSSARQLHDLPAYIHRAASGTDPNAARWLLRLFFLQVRDSDAVDPRLRIFVEQALLPVITDRRHNVDRGLGLSRPPGRPPSRATSAAATTDGAALVERARVGDVDAAKVLLHSFFARLHTSDAIDQRLLRHVERSVLRRICDPTASIAAALGIVRSQAHRPRVGPTEAHIELRDMAVSMLADGKTIAAIVRDLKAAFPAWSHVTVRNEVRVVDRFLRAVKRGPGNSANAAGRVDAEVAVEFDRRSQDEVANLARVRYEPDPLAAAFFSRKV